MPNQAQQAGQYQLAGGATSQEPGLSARARLVERSHVSGQDRNADDEDALRKIARFCIGLAAERSIRKSTRKRTVTKKSANADQQSADHQGGQS